MERIQSDIYPDTEALQNALCFVPDPAGSCFFDIETTGLSARISSLYLIGAAIWENDHFRFCQWFADDYTSEADILQEFTDFSAGCQSFIHYNGTTFDIPYLEKKYTAHHLPSPFSEKNSIDLYRALPHDKNFFHTPDRKLTTMERLTGFIRTDSFSGKDCIKLYTDYMQMKYFKDSGAAEKKEQLLLHNREDIIGTILCLSLYSFVHGTIDASSVTLDMTEDGIQIRGTLSQGVYPFSHSGHSKPKEDDTFAYAFTDSTVTITVPFCRETMYYFFKDYKNYFYLPEEDMAVHKSVGIYVEKEHRRQATASNCYIRKDSTFVPVFLPDPWKKPPLYRDSVRSRRYYLSVDDFEKLSDSQRAELLTGCLSLL